MRSKTVQNRSFSGRQTKVEPWNLDRRFPLHIVDYTHTRTAVGAFHLHDVLEIGWCRSGQGVFMVEDKAYAFKEGDVFVIGTSEAHFAYSPRGTPSQWSFLFVDPPRLLGPAADPALFDLAGCCGPRFENLFRGDRDALLCETVRKIVDEFRKRKHFYRDAIKSLVVNFLVELQRRQEPAKQSRHRAQRSYETMRSIEPALNMMARDYRRSITLGALAKGCFMSVSHFRRVFSSQMGVSPRDYILGCRIAMAACLLSGTAQPVTAIAYETGFQTISSFNRQFQKRKKCSPREWRRQSRAE